MNPVGIPQRIICPECNSHLLIMWVASNNRDSKRLRARHCLTGYCSNDNKLFAIPTVECTPIEEHEEEMDANIQNGI